MKAAVLKEWKHIELSEINMPRPRDNEVLIRVAYAGICGSDRKIFNGLHPIAQPPLILSHEISGLVWEHSDSSGKAGFQKGERVALRPVLSCGGCHSCRQGRENICESVRILGIHEPGGLAEFICAPKQLVYPLPEHISLAEGALAEPIADALHHIYRSGFQIGRKTAVIGADFTGILIAYILKFTGAAKSVLVDDRRESQALARLLGLEVCSPSELVYEDTGSFGAAIGEFDIIYEATGTLLGFRTMTKALALGGTGVIVGVPTKDLPLNIRQIFMKELSIRGCRLHTEQAFAAAIRLMADPAFMNPLNKLLGPQFTLREAAQKADDIFSGSQGTKTMIRVMEEEESS